MPCFHLFYLIDYFAQIYDLKKIIKKICKKKFVMHISKYRKTRSLVAPFRRDDNLPSLVEGSGVGLSPLVEGSGMGLSLLRYDNLPSLVEGLGVGLSPLWLGRSSILSFRRPKGGISFACTLDPSSLRSVGMTSLALSLERLSF